MKNISKYINKNQLLKKIKNKFRRIRKLDSFDIRMEKHSLERMEYAYICFNAAKLAKKLGHNRISVIEYGVAGGRGLLILEEYVSEIKKLLGVEIDIYGFDSGKGLPKPVDYRDLPYHWKEGFFNMDENLLRSKLKFANLVIGDIELTYKTFFSKYKPAPIGAIVHDFDFYSSTKIALSMLKEDKKYYLPRVYCYFDDTVGGEIELYNDYTGERLAIHEFNSSNYDIKLAIPYHLMAKENKLWHHQIWISHFFQHHQYTDFHVKIQVLFELFLLVFFLF